MPITRGEFEAGGKLSSPVLDFLKKHVDEAFTFSELADEVRKSDLTLDDLDAALRLLVDRNLVEIRMIENKVYYSYRAGLGFRLR